MHTTIPEDIIAMDDEVLELALLLRRQHVAILESLAQRQGITVGQFVRQLIDSHIHRTIGAEQPRKEPILQLRTFR